MAVLSSHAVYNMVVGLRKLKDRPGCLNSTISRHGKRGAGSALGLTRYCWEWGRIRDACVAHKPRQQDSRC